MAMRGTALLLLLLPVLGLPPRAAGQSAASAAAPVAAAPGTVAALGGLLAAALPGLSSVNPAAPAPVALPSLALPAQAAGAAVPALLDARKAAVLLRRAEAAASTLKPAEGAATAPSAPPLKVLEAVNSVLKDFTPEQLQSMPEDRLQALAGVILDGAAGRAPRADLEASVVLAEAGLAKVEAARAGVRETLLNPGHNETHADMITARGVPEAVRRVDAQGTVFRHYTTKEGLEAILRTKSLWNGFMPYVQLANAVYHKTFRDLTGVFLTLPGVEGERVGVPKREFDHYVDIRVSARLPVLEVEKKAIYLIPMPGRARAWVADLYRRWMTGGDVGTTYARTLQDVEEDGGPGPELAVPIEIVDSGKVK